MGIKINLPYYLQHFVGNRETVDVEGITVRECLLNLSQKYPLIMPELFDFNGDLAVIVLHGEMPISDSMINSPVNDGDTIALFPIIVGG